MSIEERLSLYEVQDGRKMRAKSEVDIYRGFWVNVIGSLEDATNRATASQRTLLRFAVREIRAALADRVDMIGAGLRDVAKTVESERLCYGHAVGVLEFMMTDLEGFQDAINRLHPLRRRLLPVAARLRHVIKNVRLNIEPLKHPEYASPPDEPQKTSVN
jgi:hypothetical protein